MKNNSHCIQYIIDYYDVDMTCVDLPGRATRETAICVLCENSVISSTHRAECLEIKSGQQISQPVCRKQFQPIMTYNLKKNDVAISVVTYCKLTKKCIGISMFRSDNISLLFDSCKAIYNTEHYFYVRIKIPGKFNSTGECISVCDTTVKFFLQKMNRKNVNLRIIPYNSEYNGSNDYATAMVVKIVNGVVLIATSSGRFLPVPVPI